MRDMGLVPFDEPMMALYNQGMVLGEDGEKMSKSRGNVVAPDRLVAQYGADAVRTYLMFFAKWDQGGPWNYDGIKGPQRLLYDVWEIGMFNYEPINIEREADRALRRKTHQVIRKVTEDLESFSFNTAVAAIMELRNAIGESQKLANVSQEIWDDSVKDLLLLLAPTAPHITEELWQRNRYEFSIHQQPWPVWDEESVKEDTVTLIIQINGKVRDRIQVPANSDDEFLKETALASEKVQQWLAGKELRKVIVVKGKLVNVVI
jgi:leucyl-tRNA synthetase